MLADSKCTDVVVLDVRGHSQVCDYVIIGTGTSQRQMRSVAQESEELGGARGTPAYRSTRDAGTTWVLVDFVETVVHLFEPDQRLYYDIELLWGSATRVEWKRGADVSPPHAPVRKSPALPALAASAPVVPTKRAAEAKVTSKVTSKVTTKVRTKLATKAASAKAPEKAPPTKPAPKKKAPAKKTPASKVPSSKTPVSKGLASKAQRSKAVAKKTVRAPSKARIAKDGAADD